MSVSPYDIPPRLKADGSPCCAFFDATGPRILQACDDCQRHYLAALARRRADYAPPDSYAAGLKALRAKEHR
jgi:hypothetical protein